MSLNRGHGSDGVSTWSKLNGCYPAMSSFVMYCKICGCLHVNLNIWVG